HGGFVVGPLHRHSSPIPHPHRPPRCPSAQTDLRRVARKGRRKNRGEGELLNGLLVRVGADLSPGGGTWNGPTDSETGDFAYVPIPENSPVHQGLMKPYSSVAPTLQKFGVRLPTHLAERHMHLDPDFAHLTYGDQGERAKQLRA